MMSEKKLKYYLKYEIYVLGEGMAAIIVAAEPLNDLTDKKCLEKFVETEGVFY